MSDSQVDVQVLRTVHEFYVVTLAQRLGHTVPLPSGLDEDGGETTLVRWLGLLDLAISAPMVRDALSQGTSDSTAKALLRYYVSKPSHAATDRDKADFVVTWLYRNPPAGLEWHEHGAFGRHLVSFAGEPAKRLPEEHLQLVREFDYISDEVDDVRNFDALMESGILQRVRDIKASFGESFYHPTVLARVAEYNAHFGKKFDELFHQATQQIKSFAESIQQLGGSVAPRLDGVTVKQLTDDEEKQILNTEYREAQEQFRKVSRLQKAVDSRRAKSGSRVPPAEPPVRIEVRRDPIPYVPAYTGTTVDPSEALVEADDPHASEVPANTQLANKIEDGKIVTIQDTIRNFVRAADPSRAQVVPMRHGNFVLTEKEIEAFRVDYGLEKSFRADLANTVVTVVAVIARIETELADYRAKKGSAYLWKQHADSLAYLLKLVPQVTTRAHDVMATAKQRGLIEKANNISASLARLDERVALATQTLAQLGTRSSSI